MYGCIARSGYSDAGALEFLCEGGLFAGGEGRSRFRGRGLEYAETRGYVPNDLMDVFEWKATARTSAPNVKQHYLERGGAFHVVHDEGAPDPVSMDEVGARFLGLVLSLAQTGARLRLSTLEGGAAAEKALGEGSAVEATLCMCLRGRVEEFRKYHRLIDPAKLRVLCALGDTWAGTSPGGLLASPEAQERVMVVSSMCGDPVPMIEAVGSGGAGAAVLRPRES